MEQTTTWQEHLPQQQRLRWDKTVWSTKLVLPMPVCIYICQYAVVSRPTFTLLWYQCSAIIVETALQSYSLNKFSGLKINAQILNDAIGVLEKMFKHISLHTDTYTHAQISCTPLITLSLQIPLLSISRTGFLVFFFLLKCLSEKSQLLSI